MASAPAADSPGLLLLAAGAIAVAWQLPYGPQALYPLTLLATFAHEMGHGLAALLVGGHFDRLSLHADGSGLAGEAGRLARVLLSVFAAGLALSVAMWVRNPFGIAFLLAAAVALAAAGRWLGLRCLVPAAPDGGGAVPVLVPRPRLHVLGERRHRGASSAPRTAPSSPRRCGSHSGSGER